MDSTTIFVLVLTAGFFSFIGYLAVLSRRTEKIEREKESRKRAA